MTIIIAILSFKLLLFQGVCTFILLSRLARGARRIPPLTPKLPYLALIGKVSVIIPTLNECDRISPLLESITRQSYETREIIFVDSNSTDGTQEKIENYSKKDPRIHLITDPPLPKNWVGRPWALHNGFLNSSENSEWILGVDADTIPHKNLVATVLDFAIQQDYDLVSFSPQFILKSMGEWWLQPSLLMTLLFRFESSGVNTNNPSTIMANGQCFLIKRNILTEINGYTYAANSFCDDVTLARYVASLGYKVGFADGSKIIKVRMYEGLQDTWQGWGRSLDLKDASSKLQLWEECLFLLLIQALPLPLFFLCLFFYPHFDFLSFKLLFALNTFLVIIRFALLGAIASSYQFNKSISELTFILSPFADILAVTRIILSALTKPSQWRGRVYE